MLHQLARLGRPVSSAGAYEFSPNCVPVVQTSLHQMLAALQGKKIRAVVTLRNVDDQGQPAWAAQLNPPRTDSG